MNRPLRFVLVIATLATPMLAVSGQAASFPLLMHGILLPGETTSLNPQPLPPKSKLKFRFLLGDEVMLNPQPLPPKDGFEGSFHPGDEVMLNPQPLPPKELQFEE